jgi:hypothetical protein
MKAYKSNGRERSKAWKVVVTIVMVLCGVSSASAVPDWDIYSDTDIYDGQYNLINIYDTPPDHTTVNMYGGSADFVGTFDSSTLNFYSGNAEVGAFDTSIINISGGTLSGAAASDHGVVNFSGDADSRSVGASAFGTVNVTGGTVEHVGANDSGTINLYGGVVTDFLGASGLAVVNMYGYGFDYDPGGGALDGGQVRGYWLDDTPLTIDLYGSETYLHIELIPAVEVEIDIRPRAVNFSSKGKWISCKMWLPEDYNVADVNSASVLLEGEVPAKWIWFNEKQNVVMAKFPRSEIAEILEPGEVELTVSGYLMDGSYFVGTDTIKVIDKGRSSR